MSYIYRDPTREDDPYALPYVEVFYARPVVIECDNCGNSIVPWDGTYYNTELECPSCLNPARAGRFAQASTGSYWYWPCFDGCLPDGDPIGAYKTEQEAIDAAQEE